VVAERRDHAVKVDLGVVVLGGERGEAAPAAAQVEHAHARLEADLAADQVELRTLRLGQS
jgi:hypothetical protein